MLNRMSNNRTVPLPVFGRIFATLGSRLRRLAPPLLALSIVAAFVGLASLGHTAHADTGSASVVAAPTAAPTPAPTATPATPTAATSTAATVPSSPAAAPDPIGHPVETLSTLEKLYKSGNIFALVIVVLFCGLAVAVKEDSWFREGKRAAYFAGALGVLAVLAVPAAQGNTPNLQMFLTALIPAIALLLPNALKKASS